MSITLNTKSYDLDSNPTPDSARYVGPANTFAVKDILDLKRTMPKPTASSRGYYRTQVKFVKTYTLDDSTTDDVIITVDARIPVGVSDANNDLARDDVGDLLISTVAGDLYKTATLIQ